MRRSHVRGRSERSFGERIPAGSWRGATAFTLIEILVALMVLSVGMSSVLAVFIAGVRASQDVVDESAAALSAKAVMVRILTEETEVAGRPVRIFLNVIVRAREDGYRFVWIHREPHYTNEGVPDAVPVAEGSRYSWRCRASSFRSNPQDPVMDLGRKGPGGGEPVMLKEGRVQKQQMDNPDSDELWRLAIEIYRSYKPGAEPIATFQTYVCTAHM